MFSREELILLECHMSVHVSRMYRSRKGSPYSEESKLQRFEDNERELGLHDGFLNEPCIVIGHISHGVPGCITAESLMKGLSSLKA